MKTKHSIPAAFGYAFQGCITFLRNDRNGRIQFGIAVVVILMCFIIGISVLEWCIILLCISLVISLEMMNSAIEKVCDKINPQKDPVIKIIKDVAAGAVLLASLISTVIALLIFIPKLIV